MNPLLLEILPWLRQGYCCSQLLALLMLRGLGDGNPTFVRAMHGLCHGLGAGEGPCGLLTGGACVLACLAGRGAEAEQAHPQFVPLVSDYQEWFAQRTENYGGPACFQIVQGLGGERKAAPSQALCGDFLAECWEKILSLLEAYDIPLESR